MFYRNDEIESLVYFLANWQIKSKSFMMFPLLRMLEVVKPHLDIPVGFLHPS